MYHIGSAEVYQPGDRVQVKRLPGFGGEPFEASVLEPHMAGTCTWVEDENENVFDVLDRCLTLI